MSKLRISKIAIDPQDISAFLGPDPYALDEAGQADHTGAPKSFGPDSLKWDFTLYESIDDLKVLTEVEGA